MHFFIALTLTVSAFAYVPPLTTILSRTTDNHGKGFARVTQNVVFTHNNAAFIVQEVWLTDGSQRMVLKATGQNDLGQKFQFQAYYNQGNRHFVDAAGARKVSKVGEDWYEDLFYQRSSDGMLARLHTLKMVPSEALRRPPDVNSIRNITHPIESFTRLARSGGKIAYAISTNPPTKEDPTDPTIWIEQDGFVVLKVRLPSQSTVTASDYKSYSDSFHFSGQKEIQWKNNRALINTTKVETFGRGHSISREISVNAPDPARGALVMPAIDSLQEFYSRFR